MPATKTRRKFSAEQNAYLLATATVETLEATAKAEIAAANLPMDTDDEIDAYCDFEGSIRERLQISKAYEIQREARNTLFSWSHARVKELPQYRPVAAEIEMVFREGAKSVRFVNRLIDLSMQLSA